MYMCTTHRRLTSSDCGTSHNYIHTYIIYVLPHIQLCTYITHITYITCAFLCIQYLNMTHRLDRRLTSSACGKSHINTYIHTANTYIHTSIHVYTLHVWQVSNISIYEYILYIYITHLLGRRMTSSECGISRTNTYIKSNTYIHISIDICILHMDKTRGRRLASSDCGTSNTNTYIHQIRT